jgi:taurine dioxygenase
MGKLQIRPLAYALGAEVTGVDLRKALDAEVVSEIRKAALDHIVLCFPGQELEPEAHMAFCRNFGALDDNRLSPHLCHPDYSEVMLIFNKPMSVKDKTYSGGQADMWHTDLSFTDRPASLSFLNAKALPSIGGDTMFANMYMAYDALSLRLKEVLEPLEAVHDVNLSTNISREIAEVQAERRRLNPPIVHPVVRIHPETGRKALYLGDRVRNFLGMTREETMPLLQFLNGHATRHEFIYRHRWRSDDLLIWDNRCALHYAVPDFDRSELRKMQRCSLLAPKSGAPPGEPRGASVEASHSGNRREGRTDRPRQT